MNHRGQAHWWLVAIAAAQLAILPLGAQNAPVSPAPVRLSSALTNIFPPAPQLHSPVDYFRKLLAMTPAERANYLTNQTPDVRERILAKVREYLTLDPNERELRLDATELRWYLLPLLRESPTNRAVRLAQVPDNLRDLVQSRLVVWDALPAASRQEFLDNESVLHYLSRVNTTTPPPGGVSTRTPSDAEQVHWAALSEADRERITAQFSQFFELPPDEKQKALHTLSDAERKQMEQTLQEFDKLPIAKRADCIRAFTQFAGMSPAERAEFLKNAERWSQLSPKERQAWRDLVAQVPLWPPLPAVKLMPPKLPPPPPSLPRPLPHIQSAVATNRN